MKYKDIFESKNLVLNSSLIKSIHNYNFSLNEFLLLLYFLNTDSKKFVIDDIKKVLDLSKSDILSALNSLIEKKVLELKALESTKGNIQEYVCLEKFYNQFETVNSDDDKQDIDTLKMFIENKFKIVLDEKDKKIIASWLSRDLTITKLKNIIGKLDEKTVNNIRCIDKLITDLSSDSSPNTNLDLFDYNWLEDERK